MSISFPTVTEVTCAKYCIKMCAEFNTFLLFACKALKNKIRIIIAHLLHAFFPQICKLFNLTKC